MLEAHYRIWILFGAGGEDRSDGEIVDWFAVTGQELIGIVGGETDDATGRHDSAGVGWWQIVLTKVKRGVEQHGEVGAIVYDEECAGVATDGGDSFGFLEHVAGEKTLVAELEDAGVGFEDRFGGVGGIDDRIKTRDSTLKSQFNVRLP